MWDTGFQAAFRFVIAALAVWRLSFLLAREDGPGEALAKWRRTLGGGVLGGLFGCVKCLSLWLAAPFTFFVGGTTLEKVVTWLALSGVAALVDEWTRPPFEWKETADDELLHRDRDSSAH